MKKILAFLLSALALSTLIVSCGGGDSADNFTLTVQRFKAGWGVRLLMNPTMEIGTGASGDIKTHSGSLVTIDGYYEVDENGDYVKDASGEYVLAEYEQEGETVYVTRNVEVSGASYPARLVYRVTSNGMGVLDISFESVDALSDRALASAIGILLEETDMDDQNRNTMYSLEGCKIQLVLNFAAATAQATISATTVKMVDLTTETEYVTSNLTPISSAKPISYELIY